MKQYALNRSKFLDSTELAELTRILGMDQSDSRNSLLIKLALNTGARASELLNLRRIDVSTIDRSVYLTGLKGSNDREIPLDNALFSSLQAYLATHSDERVFPIGYTTLLKIWHYYRPVKKKFHSLRHTFAVNLYKNTKDIHLVKLALGHKSIKNTEIYLNFVYSQTEMRKLLLGRKAA